MNELTDLEVLQIIRLLKYPYSKLEFWQLIKEREVDLGAIIYDEIKEILVSIKKHKEAQNKAIITGNYNLKKAGSLEWFGPTSQATEAQDSILFNLISDLSLLVGYPPIEEEREENLDFDDYEIKLLRG